MRERVLTTRRAPISQHPVILSGVVVREADGNAVEGSLDRLQYRAVSENFYPAHFKKPEARYSTVTDLARFLG
jgi:hypothetical protein